MIVIIIISSTALQSNTWSRQMTVRLKKDKSRSHATIYGPKATLNSSRPSLELLSRPAGSLPCLSEARCLRE